MNEKQKNKVIAFGILAVICLIIFMVPSKDKSLFKSAVLNSAPHFPTQKSSSKESMEALLSGRLTLQGRCLKINENLIVWPNGFSMEVRGDLIRVLDQQGKTVAYIGDSLKLGGGQITSPSGDLPQFINEDCKGPLWITGQVLSQRK